ncbi:MAG: LysR family transcriptional regulator [Pseudomonadota bacterium]
MDRFAEWETFVAVVEEGSLTRGAHRLGVAVSAVSRRLADLERRLGVRLAQRSARGVVPTADGETYYTRCQRLLEDARDADNAVVPGERGLTGVVRFTAPLSFSMRHLTPLIAQFATQHPELRLDIDMSDRVVDLTETGFDFALRIGELASSQLKARRLCRIRSVPVAAPSYWARTSLPKTPDDLVTTDALSYALSDTPHQWSYTAPGLSASAPRTLRVAPRMTVANGDFMAEMAAAGLGFTVVPSFIVDEALREGRLEIGLPQCSWFDMHAYLVYPPGRPLPARSRAVMDALVVALCDPPPWDVRLIDDGILAAAPTHAAPAKEHGPAK